MRFMRARQQGRRADEAEVPADAEQNEGDVELFQRHAGQRDGPGGGEDGKAETDDLRRAEPRDQVAGEEGGDEHREDMAGDDMARVAGVVAAADDGERGRGHDQVHQRVADHRADHRDEDHRIAQQRAPAAAQHLAARLAGRSRYVQEEEQRRAGEVERDHRKIGAVEGDGQDLRRVRRQRRADDRRDQTPRHDPGNRLGPERVRGHVAGREAVEALRRHVDPGEEGTGEEDQERPGMQPVGRDRRAKRAARAADPEPGPPPVAPHQRRQGRGRKHRAEHDHRDRQRREAGVGRQHLAGQPAHDEDHRHLRAEDGLCGDKHDDVALGARVIVLHDLIGECHGPSLEPAIPPGKGGSAGAHR